MKWIGYAALAAYIATIVIATWLVEHVGIVDVGFGLEAPAAVYAAGFAFTFRDIVQRTLGRGPAVMAIVFGACLSLNISPTFAVASAVAFLVSELCDFAVYTPMSERSFLGAVVLSNTVGAVIDSILFLWIAFGSLDFFAGQVVGKMETTFVAVALLALAGLVLRRRAVLPRHA